MIEWMGMDDPFDDLLNLEEQYYEEGYEQGFADGRRQSRLEAKLFGIEKGFEKFVIMGKLQARARIWAARLPGTSCASDRAVSSDLAVESDGVAKLLPLQGNARLDKHISMLLALVDPATLSMENTDDAVAEFDDRLKRAQAKEKVIERIVGEDASGRKLVTQQGKEPSSALGDMENFGKK